jgi:hypothetical protein
VKTVYHLRPAELRSQGNRIWPIKQQSDTRDQHGALGDAPHKATQSGKQSISQVQFYRRIHKRLTTPSGETIRLDLFT